MTWTPRSWVTRPVRYGRFPPTQRVRRDVGLPDRHELPPAVASRNRDVFRLAAAPTRDVKRLRRRPALSAEVVSPELHRGHFSHRRGSRPARRYLERFDEIRALQEHLVACARQQDVAVVDNENVDAALASLMDLVLDAVTEVT